MEERQRSRERSSQDPQEDVQPSPETGARLGEVSEELEAQLTQGDEIIERHLSRNSQEFVRSMRQTGGE